jgi:hypothetical protein
MACPYAHFQWVTRGEIARCQIFHSFLRRGRRSLATRADYPQELLTLGSSPRSTNRRSADCAKKRQQKRGWSIPIAILVRPINSTAISPFSAISQIF